MGLVSPEEASILRIQYEAEQAEIQKQLVRGMRTRKQKEEKQIQTKRMLEHYDKTSSSGTPIKGEMSKMKALKEDLDEGVWKEKAASKKNKKESLDEQ